MAMDRGGACLLAPQRRAADPEDRCVGSGGRRGRGGFVGALAGDAEPRDRLHRPIDAVRELVVARRRVLERDAARDRSNVPSDERHVALEPVVAVPMTLRSG